jgi:U3 small nucleolar RNA-associated protein 5
MTKKSSKSLGGRQTYTSTISQPFLPETILSAFSQDGKFFALVTLAVDKHRLRIFNGISGRATAECTIPSGRVSSLVWSTFFLDADVEQTSPSKKKKKRKTEEAEEKDRGSPGIAIVALGLSDGSILLFSPSHSKVVRTLSHGSSTSAILALTSSLTSNSHLWSSGADSSIQLWDVQKATMLKTRKNDDRIPYTSLALDPHTHSENETNLLVAHHHIRLLNEISLSSSSIPKELASFTGHASPIRTLRWIQSAGIMRRFCSAAEGDRYIYLWDAQDTSTNEKPVASVLLDSDVRTLGFDCSDPSRTTLIALSSSGCLTFIPIPAELPSEQRSTEDLTKIHSLLPRSTLRNGRKCKSDPLIIDFTSIPSNIGSVRLVRLVNGIKPVFDVVVSLALLSFKKTYSFSSSVIWMTRETMNKIWDWRRFMI